MKRSKSYGEYNYSAEHRYFLVIFVYRHGNPVSVTKYFVVVAVDCCIISSGSWLLQLLDSSWMVSGSFISMSEVGGSWGTVAVDCSITSSGSWLLLLWQLFNGGWTVLVCSISMFEVGGSWGTVAVDCCMTSSGSWSICVYSLGNVHLLSESWCCLSSLSLSSQDLSLAVKLVNCRWRLIIIPWCPRYVNNGCEIFVFVP